MALNILLEKMRIIIFKFLTKKGDKTMKRKCVFCGEAIKDYGNDPYPVKEYGRCCDKCNMNYVIPARIEELAKEQSS